MKANALVFIFLIFLVASGIWLLDGLSDAFGPERLTHHRAQSDSLTFEGLSRLANRAGNPL